MEIRANRERCVSAGLCVMSAPEVFDQDESDGRVLLLARDLPPEQLNAVREAVSLCPATALSLGEAGPGRRA